MAVVINEPGKSVLVERTVGADLFAPASLHWEMGNAFAAMLKRGRITLEQAHEATRVYRTIPLRLLEVDLVRSLELADRLGIYAYDAYVIVAALDRQCPLLSLDGGLIRAAKRMGVQVRGDDR